MHVSLALIIGMSLVSLLATGQPPSKNEKPVRIGVVGLVHAHVHWILGRPKQNDIEIVGIAEPNRALAEAYSKQHGYPMTLVYSSLEELIDKTKPEAVLAFNPIFDHLRTVEYCAPRGIHVMVEKPLAVSQDHASKMATLASQHKIHLLTNYETTWYPSNTQAKAWVKDESRIGPIRKIVFHTGHPGPVEIGCNPEFLEWLTDPVLNGGGALTDFGCYGANLATWFMNGETPLTVSAITQQIKPNLYPKVEDEATILLTYPKAQVIIQASWNWPFSRKDMEMYGTTGYIFCKDNKNMLLNTSEKLPTQSLIAPDLAKDRYDPFVYFSEVIRGRIKPEPFDLSALPNNEMVVKILEAAKHSVRTGQKVVWAEFYK